MSKSEAFAGKNILRPILFFLTICLMGIVSYLGSSIITKSRADEQGGGSLVPPEITKILNTKSAHLRSIFYTNLIERVGPIQAQNDLYHSGLSFDGDTHLLNHTVGNWLYKKYKEKGIVYCRDYFLSSCYHGLLIPVIAEGGLNNLKQVMEICNKQGKTTAVQCTHGIGHGLLAWEDYGNLPKALADCDIVAKIADGFTPYNCYDGVFMENNWAIHNDGKPSPNRWISTIDPSYPCYDNRIDEKYRRACWSNQPQVMYRQFNGDIDKVAAECENIKAIAYQDTCFDSLARQINPQTRGDVNTVFILCDKMPVGWKNACVISNVSAFFSIGDHNIPLTLCSMIPESGQSLCYQTLEDRMNLYVSDLTEKINICSQIPKEHRLAYCPSV